MQVMKRATWPRIMEQADESVLILAPWIDDDLVRELFGFLPPVDIRIVFPRSLLEEKGPDTYRYFLRGVLDINLNVAIRLIDEEIPACLVIDGEDFYHSQRHEDWLRDEGVVDTESGIELARRIWDRGEDWS